MTLTDSPQMRKPPEPDKRGDFHETYKEIVPMSLEFLDALPEDGRSRIDHAGVAAQLRANPGKWALVFEDKTAAVARNIKVGVYQAYAPAGSFEAVSRRSASGERRDIYARYVGESGKSA